MVDYINEQLIRASKISRRGLVAGAMATGLASRVWAGTDANTPVKGGHLRAGMNDANTSDSLDPGTFLGTHVISVSRAARDSLLEIGPDNTLQPALAESWEASSDAKSWRFKLRKGVEFSDGKSLTAEDVINSLNVHRGSGSQSGAVSLFQSVSDVRKDGPDTVVVELSAPNAIFPYVLTDMHVCVMPTKDGKADVLSPIGTGCYKITEYVPGVRANLERNPNSWQSGKCGFFDSAELIVLLDDAARQNALISGNVDVISRPPLKTAKMLTAAPGLRLVDVPSNLIFAHSMFCDVAPFSDKNFRLALKHALPRQEFLDKVLYGFGHIGNDNPIGPLMPSFDPSIAVNNFDLDKARFYMKQAGMEGGVSVDYSAADTAYTGALDAAVLFQESFAKIGVKMNIIREPNDGYWTNVWLMKPFCASYWGSLSTEDMILSYAWTSKAPWNDAHWSDPRVDKLVLDARAQLDPAKRSEIYRDVQAIISTEGGHLIPGFGNNVAAANDKIGTPDKVSGLWEMDGAFFVKRWWMKA